MGICGGKKTNKVGNLESKAIKSQGLSEFESIRIAVHVCGGASMG